MPSLFEKRRATTRELSYMRSRLDDLTQPMFRGLDVDDCFYLAVLVSSWLFLALAATALVGLLPLLLARGAGWIDPSRQVLLRLLSPLFCLFLWLTRNTVFGEQRAARQAAIHRLQSDIEAGEVESARISPRQFYLIEPALEGIRFWVCRLSDDTAVTFSENDSQDPGECRLPRHSWPNADIELTRVAGKPASVRLHGAKVEDYELLPKSLNWLFDDDWSPMALDWQELAKGRIVPTGSSRATACTSA